MINLELIVISGENVICPPNHVLYIYRSRGSMQYIDHIIRILLFYIVSEGHDPVT